MTTSGEGTYLHCTILDQAISPHSWCGKHEQLEATMEDLMDEVIDRTVKPASKVDQTPSRFFTEALAMLAEDKARALRTSRRITDNPRSAENIHE